MNILWIKKVHPVIHDQLETSNEEKSSQNRMIHDYAINLTEIATSGDLPPTIGRSKEIELIMATLNNWEHPKIPLIVGESGVGRTNLIYGVAYKLLSVNSDVNLFLLNLPDLLSGFMFPGERETAVKNLLQEGIKSKGIFILEDLDQIGVVSGFGIPLLQSAVDQGIKMIGSMREVYKDSFAKTLLHRRIQYIHITEPDESDTVKILTGIKSFLEKHHQIQILDETIRFCVKYAGNIKGKNPAKAIHLMDIACGRARLTETDQLGFDDIMAALSLLKLLAQR
jgi:ATP-dependent Clp protease ATP-binding subunit ClpA